MDIDQLDKITTDLVITSQLLGEKGALYYIFRDFPHHITCVPLKKSLHSETKNLIYIIVFKINIYFFDHYIGYSLIIELGAYQTRIDLY